ncbi:unnamed protein product [Discosporangium mesarthrocarpum]
MAKNEKIMSNSTFLPSLRKKRDAFVQEVREAHHEKLLLYALGLSQNMNLKHLSVDDLMQEMYVSLLMKWPASEKGYRKKGVGYLFKILKFDSYDALRKEKSAKRQEEVFLIKYSAPVDLKGLGIQGHMEEFYEILRKNFQPDTCTIMQYYVLGYSYREIATLQAMPINTVGTKIARAKKKLKLVFE